MAPQINIQQQFNDNILSSEKQKRSSYITVFSPGISINTVRSNSQYSLLYNGQLGQYINSHEDDYIDQQIQADMRLNTSHRSHIKTQAKYLFLHQDRGTGFTKGSGASIKHPDKYNIRQLGAIYTYGSEESTGRIELGVYGFAQRYENRLGTIFLGNRNHIDTRATFFFHIRPKTSLLFELRNTKIDYRIETASASLDNSERRLLLGAIWDVTAITSGIAKFGVLNKDFVSSAHRNFTGFSWEAGVRWSPLTYSIFNIQTFSKTEETLGTGNFIETKTVSASWDHDWHKQFNSMITGAVTKNSFKPTKHAEGIWSIGFRLRYKMRRWLNLSAEISHSERLSTQLGLDYARNLLILDVLVKI
ncbi:MAG: outer membrane beta-barrel protein [Proteobacteria bacterium]|nr:outer membrane beta-barrel protein [Pseudomonadota bacterium]